MLRSIPVWVASLITGIVAVAYARLFAEAEHAGRRLVVHSPLMVFIVVPATFVGGWYLVNQFAPLARGSGIPQVSAALDIAGEQHNCRIRRRGHRPRRPDNPDFGVGILPRQQHEAVFMAQLF